MWIRCQYRNTTVYYPSLKRRQCLGEYRRTHAAGVLLSDKYRDNFQHAKPKTDQLGARGYVEKVIYQWRPGFRRVTLGECAGIEEKVVHSYSSRISMIALLNSLSWGLMPSATSISCNLCAPMGLPIMPMAASALANPLRNFS